MHQPQQRIAAQPPPAGALGAATDVCYIGHDGLVHQGLPLQRFIGPGARPCYPEPEATPMPDLRPEVAQMLMGMGLAPEHHAAGQPLGPPGNWQSQAPAESGWESLLTANGRLQPVAWPH